MKSFIILLIAMLMSTLTRAQKPKDDMEILTRIQFGANGELLGSPEDINTIRALSHDWLTPPRTVFNVLSPEKQSVVVQAAVESLKGDAYLDMVASVLQGVADGSIPPRVGSIALASTGSNKEGVLAVNHADPRIADVLPKVLPRYSDNPQQINFIQKLISGKAKQEHIDWYSAQGLTPAQIIKTVPSETSQASNLPAIAQPSTPMKAHEATTTSTPNKELKSSIRWSIIVVFSVAATSLLWFLLKMRK